ncbi:hypothetical protein [Candidatus Spongiihabitans sp.]|uniref:hypothetical protein n=1 Tax=Candidatus Spongiihabitans sp. TaxID=3101308 RepID=UPI003C6EE4EA
MAKHIFRVAVIHTVQTMAKADIQGFISIHLETYTLIFFQAANIYGVRKRSISNYNKTRLKCLGYKAPLEVLEEPIRTHKNQAGHNTKAGIQKSLETLDSRPRSSRGQAVRGRDARVVNQSILNYKVARTIKISPFLFSAEIINI